MANKCEDEYWFVSNTKAFDFEDERTKLITQTQMNNYISQEQPVTIEISQSSVLSVSSVLSQQCINKLSKLDQLTNVTTKESCTLIANIINNTFLSQHYIFDNCRSFKSKNDLLDAAIELFDGNTILNVILFLKNTLQKNLFYNIVISRSNAVFHYINYLTNSLNIDELTEFLSIKDYNATHRIKLFKAIIHKISHQISSEALLKKVHFFYTNLFNKKSDDKDSSIIKNYISLLDWQIAAQKNSNKYNLLGYSVNKSLKICCQHYWDESEDHFYSPSKLSKLHFVKERQLQWIFLDIKSTEMLWKDIIKVFIKNTWLGNKKSISTSLNIENIIIMLGEKKAPYHIIEKFLVLMDNNEKSLALATKFKYHRFIINYYVSQKNRNALVNYKLQITPQSEDFIYIENVLCSNTVWKT